MMLAACGPLDRPIADDSDPAKRRGDVIMHLTGPTRLAFNFADGGAGAQRHHRPSAGWPRISRTPRKPATSAAFSPARSWTA